MRSRLLEEVICDRGLGGGNVLLDVGCGEGIIASNLASQFDTVFGIDIKDAVLDKSRFSFLQGDFCKMDTGMLKEADTVLFSLSLHHMDIDKALETAKKLVRKNGVVIISDLYSSPHNNFFTYFASQIVVDTILQTKNILGLVIKYGIGSYLTYLKRRIVFMFREGGVRHISDDLKEGRTKGMSDWNKILGKHLPKGNFQSIGLSGFLYVWKNE